MSMNALTPIIGTHDADKLNGGRGAEIMSGRGGADTVSGNSGNDHIWGGREGDDLRGNSGNDVIYGGGGPKFADLSSVVIAEDYDAQVIFEGEGAGYRNSLGWYKIDPNSGQITDVEMLWENASLQGSGGSLIGGVSSKSLDIEAGDQIGFFLTSNGYSYNNSFFQSWDGSGELVFRDGDGNPATLDSTNPQLVHVATDGTETQLRHHHYHSAGHSDNVELNPDGINHTVGQVLTESGIVRLGFEDLYNGGDRDFDDAVFAIDLGPINAKVLAGWDYDRVTGEVIAPDRGPVDPFANEDDTLSGGTGHDRLYGQRGDDVLSGDDGNDTLNGGSGDDVLYGNRGQDVLHGKSGNDTLHGGSSHDELRGGSGNDTLYGGNGHDKLYGNSGNDQLEAGSGNDVLDGGTGNDVLLGGSGNDALKGSSGDDILQGGRGNDTLIGGAGNDTASFEGAAKRVFANLKEGTATGEGKDTLSGIENLTGSSHDDKFHGNHRDNILNGNAGDDRLYGRNGHDQLDGGEGDDYLDGGSGDDVLVGGAGNDTLKGYRGADTLTGGEGDDRFVFRKHNEGGDSITDFEDGDVIDIAKLLDNLGADAETAMDQFWRLVEGNDNDVVLQIDKDGGGDAWDLDLVTLERTRLADLSLDAIYTGDVALG